AKLRKIADSKKVKSVAEGVRKYKFTRKKYLYLLLDDEAVVYCNYHKETNRQQKMTYKTFKEGIEFARKNFWIPVLVQSENELPEEFTKEIQGIEVMKILPPGIATTDDLLIRVYNNNVAEAVEADNSILLIDRKNISKILAMVEELFKHTLRINLVLRDVLDFTNKDYLAYGNVLTEISNLLINQYFSKGEQREINVLTDILLTNKMRNCNAGIDSLTLGPDGNLYLCPGFYYAQNGEIITGNLKTGFSINNKNLLSIEKAPICLHCEAFHCRRCLMYNYYGTNEYNTPTYFQCEISHLEREKSLKLQKQLHKLGINSPLTIHKLNEVEYHDPLMLLKKKKALSK
ncbi:MAG: CXXX repeat peptide maturase, partial [Desulfobacterales bacterium]|nr:CXXX repeat peptide maturase [Desulfobacterales bacterium]